MGSAAALTARPESRFSPASLPAGARRLTLTLTRVRVLSRVVAGVWGRVRLTLGTSRVCRPVCT